MRLYRVHACYRLPAATRNTGALGTLYNRWRAVAVQRRNFEVYRDCLSGIDEDDQEHEGEMGDFVAATGMQQGRLFYRATQNPFLCRHRHTQTHIQRRTRRGGLLIQASRRSVPGGRDLVHVGLGDTLSRQDHRGTVSDRATDHGSEGWTTRPDRRRTYCHTTVERPRQHTCSISLPRAVTTQVADVIDRQIASSVSEHQRQFRRGIERARCPILPAYHAGRHGPQKTSMAGGHGARSKLDAMCEPSCRTGESRGNPQMRQWRGGNLPFQQAVRTAAENLQAEW